MGTASRNRPASQILFGQTRRAVLRLLFGHADQSFYLRQVQRAVGAGMGAVQREIRQLTEAGILRSTKRGNQVFYQANRESPIYTELKSLVIKTTGVLDVLREALLPLQDRIQVAFVYGSFARQEEQAGSDVDLVVVGSAGFGEVVASLQPTQNILAREISPVVFPIAEFRAKLRSGNHFLTSILRRPKLFVFGAEHELARLGAKRMAPATSNEPGRNRRSARHRRP